MLKSADVLKGWKGVLVNVYVDFKMKKVQIFDMYQLFLYLCNRI